MVSNRLPNDYLWNTPCSVGEVLNFFGLEWSVKDIASEDAGPVTLQLVCALLIYLYIRSSKYLFIWSIHRLDIFSHQL